MITPLPLHRKLLYAALATGFALTVLLLATEAILRLADYGHSSHFVRRATTPSGEKIWRENRWCTAPYFSPELVRRPVPFSLSQEKSADTYRIVVLGSSAAMGDPEASFSFARALETLLRAAYPKINFEIVNAAITATNSHLAREIAADCAPLRPDLFIVYEGHNEVIGPFGPAGVFAPFLQSENALRLAAFARTTRTGQVINATARALASRGQAPAEWRGMQMFLRQQIALDDPRLAAVRSHFAANLRSIAATACSADARVLFCTVATNQRDFAPFLSLHRSELTPEQLTRWDAALASALAAERANDLPAAEQHYRAALALDDRHAELAFRLGRLLLRTGREAEARPLLQRALDLDALRFRTDSALNQVIRDTAAQLPAATLVDLAQDLATLSPQGLIGDELLYEHVHFTFRGAYETARLLLPAIITDLNRRNLASGPAPAPLSLEETRSRLAFTVYEQTMIALELLSRFRAPPFTAQADSAARLDAWQRRVETATQLLQRPNATEGLRSLYEKALAHSPRDWYLNRNYAQMLIARSQPAAALAPLERARVHIPDDPDTLIALGLAHRALGQAEPADAAFAQARALEPRHPLLPAR